MPEKMRVLITCKWPDPVEAEAARRFDVTFTPDEKPLSPEDLVTALREYDGILSTITNRFTREVFEKAGKIRTKIIANFGVGYAHIGRGGGEGHGVIVANTPDVLTDCTADTALLLMLMAARRLPRARRWCARRQWSGFGPTHFPRHAADRQDARRHRHGPHRPGDRAPLPLRLRHGGDLPQPPPRWTMMRCGPWARGRWQSKIDAGRRTSFRCTAPAGPRTGISSTAR